ncbi:Histidine kinase-like ATPase domain-containing protein [Streptomyces sp. DI166]|uniref:ATP-binding protein n=1 Tax=Streptomyces sp. DI166 TaxID=1839783 RepID=UPI0007F51D33|nr:ATP-binding protein [Streptomyces sp. DI166]SBT88565.1 Histidine kinase-like ATPase domain-containing protein [Streptomyces sp. DI166]
MNAEIITPTAELARRISATPRGARLARHLATQQLGVWGFPHDSQVSVTVQHIVAELAANAVIHGRVPGRAFELRLMLLAEDTLRIEVSDARGERKLRYVTEAEGENGRGLVIVTLLARTWGVAERDVGKTVWAEVGLDFTRPSRDIPPSDTSSELPVPGRWSAMP